MGEAGATAAGALLAASAALAKRGPGARSKAQNTVHHGDDMG
jgi:hypothetical protein